MNEPAEERSPRSHSITIEKGGHARVRVGEAVVATTENALILRETSHPARLYVPIGDIDAGALTPTDKSSVCPYKGKARYWTVSAGGRTVENGAWAYDSPKPEVALIAGHVAFYDEGTPITVER